MVIERWIDCLHVNYINFHYSVFVLASLYDPFCFLYANCSLQWNFYFTHNSQYTCQCVNEIANVPPVNAYRDSWRDSAWNIATRCIRALFAKFGGAVHVLWDKSAIDSKKYTGTDAVSRKNSKPNIISTSPTASSASSTNVDTAHFTSSKAHKKFMNANFTQKLFAHSMLSANNVPTLLALLTIILFSIKFISIDYFQIPLSQTKSYKKRTTCFTFAPYSSPLQTFERADMEREYSAVRFMAHRCCC